jgi:hypothetical protein
MSVQFLFQIGSVQVQLALDVFALLVAFRDFRR